VNEQVGENLLIFLDNEEIFDGDLTICNDDIETSSSLHSINFD
jgi:hypothetical protein